MTVRVRVLVYGCVRIDDCACACVSVWLCVRVRVLLIINILRQYLIMEESIKHLASTFLRLEEPLRILAFINMIEKRKRKRSVNKYLNFKVMLFSW